MIKKNFLILITFININFNFLNAFYIKNKPLNVLPNHHTDFGIITGVDFKPRTNIFAATYFHNQEVILYDLQKDGKTKVRQVLKNPISELSFPHGIAFHPTGNFVAVTHYGNSSINIYQWDFANNKLFEKPVSIFKPSIESKVHFSHGITFSPKGDCLAVTYCDCDKTLGYEEKVIFYPFNKKNGTISPNHFYILQQNKDQVGNPKGVVFSSDGNCVIISMCDANTLNVYDIINKEKYIMNPKPLQIVKNPVADLNRPEDIKFSFDRGQLAVTNSNGNTITFYSYDKKNNFIYPKPICVLKNPESQLEYPHGIAFSPDEKYLVITNFGIPDGPQTEAYKKREDKINIYRLRINNSKKSKLQK